MKQRLAILLLIITFVSCKKEETNPSPIEGNLKIRLSEDVDSTHRSLVLNCATEQIYGCSSFGIESKCVISNDKIEIFFTKIIKSKLCATALGPATSTIKLPDLPNKMYVLNIYCGSTKVSGKLSISTNNFTVTTLGQQQVQFTNPVLGRVPQNTIYGSVDYHYSSTAAIVQTFIDSLHFLGAATATFTQGDYSEFQIDSNGQIIQTQGGAKFSRWYIFKYSNSSAKLKSLVKNYGRNYPDSLMIRLHTTKGETVNSWTP